MFPVESFEDPGTDEGRCRQVLGGSAVYVIGPMMSYTLRTMTSGPAQTPTTYAVRKWTPVSVKVAAGLSECSVVRGSACPGEDLGVPERDAGVQGVGDRGVA